MSIKEINKSPKISVIGVGYVGLPLLVALNDHFEVTGFDIGIQRIKELNAGKDITNELNANELEKLPSINFSSNEDSIKDSDIYICCVPTPVDSSNKPNFNPVKEASKCIARSLEPGNLVIYESTVYPGATEDICKSILEKESGLLLNDDFFIGYSPERINPGDDERRISDITKLVSASNEYSLEWAYYIYSKIVKAGVHKTSSIKVAEAAKVIENIQRDLNIGLANELSVIFEKIGIDTEEVLEAASTKWNFHKYLPGLVGGHCIGVDPYYLTHKSIELGYSPELILSARKINESVASRVVDKAIDMLREKKISIKGAKVIILGIAFKENCPDTRNSKVFDLHDNLIAHGIDVDVYDPIISPEEKQNHTFHQITNLKQGYYDAAILAVPHEDIVKLGIKSIKSVLKQDSLFFDLKSYFEKSESDFRL